MADNGGGTHLPGATKGTGPVQVVRGGDDGGIYGRAQDYSEWVSGRGATDMENLGHRCTAWLFQPREARGAARWRDAQAKR